jgi:hypothetical protein
MKKMEERMATQEKATEGLSHLYDDEQASKMRQVRASRSTNPTVSLAAFKSVQDRVTELEKKTIPALQKDMDDKLKTLAGATHLASLHEVTKKVQYVFNSQEAHRKRLKNLEDIEGVTPLVKEIKRMQYQPNLPGNGATSIPASTPTDQAPEPSRPDPRLHNKSSSKPHLQDKGKSIVNHHSDNEDSDTSDDENEDEDQVL